MRRKERCDGKREKGEERVGGERWEERETGRGVRER